MSDIASLKAQIRSVLLSCGKTATEQEFRKAFYELEGVSFNQILSQYGTNFYDLFTKIPDVAKIVYARNLVFIQRVSNEATAHMDHLTINKYSKNYKGTKLVTKNGAIKGRVGTHFNAHALPYSQHKTNNYAALNSRNSHQSNGNIHPSINSNNNPRIHQYYETPAQNRPVPVPQHYVINKNMVRAAEIQHQVIMSQNIAATQRIQQQAQNMARAAQQHNNNQFQIGQKVAADSVVSQNRPTSSQNMVKAAQNLSTAAQNTTKSPPKVQPLSPESGATKNTITAGGINMLKRMVTPRKAQINDDWKETEKLSSKSTAKILPSSDVSSKPKSVINVPENQPRKPQIDDDWDETEKMASKSKTKFAPFTVPFVSFSKNQPKNPQTDDWYATAKASTSSKPISNFKNIVAPTASTTPQRLADGQTHVKLKIDENKEKLSDNKNRSFQPIKDVEDELIKLNLNDFKGKDSSVFEKVDRQVKELRCGDLKENNKENIRMTPEMIRTRARRCWDVLKIVNSNDTIKDSPPPFVPKVLRELPKPVQNTDEKFFRIKIIEVLSPEKFIFQFSFAKLKEQNVEMNKFYNELKDIEKYRMDDIAVDSIVAIRQNDSFWYRGQVQSPKGSIVEVLNVDSMKFELDLVSSKNIFHLHEKFTVESPKSAVGKLHGLKPKNGSSWSMMSASKLIDIIDKEVTATVKHVKNYVYHLSIFLDVERCSRLSDVIVQAGEAEIDFVQFKSQAKCRSLV